MEPGECESFERQAKDPKSHRRSCTRVDKWVAGCAPLQDLVRARQRHELSVDAKHHAGARQLLLRQHREQRPLQPGIGTLRTH